MHIDCIRAKDDYEGLMGETAQQQQSLPATDRGLTKPRRWWVKAARVLTFWTGLGLLFSIQVYLLGPEVGQ